jgi:hypothetical protein
MEVPDKSDIDALDLIAAKPDPKRYVYLWLLRMCRNGPRSITFRRSEPLPSLPKAKYAPPATSVGFGDVANRLKVMAGLDAVAYPRPVDAQIELNISGAPAIARVHFEDQAPDPWCQVTIEQVSS